MAPTNRRRRLLAIACFALLAMMSTDGVMSTNSRKAHLEEEAASSGGYRTFIVLLEPPSVAMDAAGHLAWHQSFMPSEVTSLGEPRLLRSYRFVVNGFAARLTEAELQQVAEKPGFVRAFPNTIRYLQTTHTPAFLGLDGDTGTWVAGGGTGFGLGVVIGVVDGGVSEGHPSMDDRNMPDPPPRWRGSCRGGFSCNKKLIGAKSFLRGEESPEDAGDGHGTHTATTAAGNFVDNVSVNGLANGTASGMAPWAHVAVYKVCDLDECPDDAILSAMDEAVNDGVDLISLSLGGSPTVTYDHDVIAVASFSAVRNGVMVVTCAGNSGPAASSVENDAPWLLTVGAGSVDRSFEAKVVLSGADPVLGESIADREGLPVSAPAAPEDWSPFLYREEGPRRYCLYPEDERGQLQGKIIICEDSSSDSNINISSSTQIDAIRSAVTESKASGVVLVQTKEDGYTFDVVEEYGAQVVLLAYDEAPRLKDYASWPLARGAIVLGGTVLGSTPAPIVASFSGRGPSLRSPGILKPDVLAPGVNILAGVADDFRTFDFMSGTSMATPHVSGIVALIKNQHPDWSPAAIRSALVTTADFVDNTGKRILDEHRTPASLYATGAGHVNASRALDPGLVYEVDEQSYARYVCSTLGEAALRAVSRNNSWTCSELGANIRESDLNYPTITVPLQPAPFVVARTVTNVAPLPLDLTAPPESYTIMVDMPPEVRVTVDPSTLSFSLPGQQASYRLTVSSTGNAPVDGHAYEGSVTLTSSSHTVRSPMVAVAGLNAPRPSTGWTLE